MSWNEELRSMPNCVARQSSKNKYGLTRPELLALCKSFNITGVNTSSTKEVMCEKLNTHFANAEAASAQLVSPKPQVKAKSSPAKSSPAKSSKPTTPKTKDQQPESWSFKGLMASLLPAASPDAPDSIVMPMPGDKTAHKLSVAAKKPSSPKKPAAVPESWGFQTAWDLLLNEKTPELPAKKVTKIPLAKVPSLEKVPSSEKVSGKKLLLKASGILKYNPALQLSPELPESKLIGSGGSGCVYAPAFKCSALDVPPCANCITKVLTKVSAERDLKTFDDLRLDELDPTGQWHIKKPTICNINPTIMPKCMIGTRLLSDPIGLTSENGGLTLTDTITNMTIDNYKNVLLQLQNILYGLSVMNDSGAYHLDIKTANIVTGPTGDGPFKLIDFGISRKLSPTFDNRFSNTEYYNIWPLDVIVMSQDIKGVKRQQELVNRYLVAIANTNPFIMKYYLTKQIHLPRIEESIMNLISQPNHIKIEQSMSKVDVYSIGMILYRIYIKLRRINMAVAENIYDFIDSSNVLHLDPKQRPTVAQFSFMYADYLDQINSTGIYAMPEFQFQEEFQEEDTFATAPTPSKTPVRVKTPSPVKMMMPPPVLENNLEKQLKSANRGVHKLFTDDNVITAVDTFLKHNVIDNNTLVVFDMDDTLVKSNSDVKRGINPMETVLDDFTLADLQLMFAKLKSVDATIAIISGRNKGQLPQSQAALDAMDLNPDHLIFLGTSKADAIRKISTRKNVVYFDDWMLGGAGDIVLELNRIKIPALGVKVGKKNESIIMAAFDDIDMFLAAIAPNADLSFLNPV